MFYKSKGTYSVHQPQTGRPPVDQLMLSGALVAEVVALGVVISTLLRGRVTLKVVPLPTSLLTSI